MTTSEILNKSYWMSMSSPQVYARSQAEPGNKQVSLLKIDVEALSNSNSKSRPEALGGLQLIAASPNLSCRVVQYRFTPRILCVFMSLGVSRAICTRQRFVYDQNRRVVSSINLCKSILPQPFKGNLDEYAVQPLPNFSD